LSECGERKTVWGLGSMLSFGESGSCWGGAEMEAHVEDVGEYRTPSGDAVKAVDRAGPRKSS